MKIRNQLAQFSAAVIVAAFVTPAASFGAADGNGITTTAAFARSRSSGFASAQLKATGVSDCSSVQFIIKEGSAAPRTIGSIRNPKGRDSVTLTFTNFASISSRKSGQDAYLKVNCTSSDDSVVVASEQNGGASTECGSGAVVSAAAKLRSAFARRKYTAVIR